MVGYPGLDPYGRVQDLHFRNAGGGAATNSTLARFEYGHDPLDQRVHARVTQRNSDGTPSENQRSWQYGYDRLGRLTAADLGALDAQNTSVAASGLVNPARESDWTMDFLGNWVGDPQTQAPGRRTLGVPWSTGPPREVKYTDVVDRTNAISTRSVVDASNPPTVKTLVHDAAGNLVLDESYLYQYDAWNRLVQVSSKGMLSATWVNGNLVWTGAAGAWIVHYTYDGLGRLIRNQSPWPTLDPYGRSQVRTEHFYYDAVPPVRALNG